MNFMGASFRHIRLLTIPVFIILTVPFVLGETGWSEWSDCSHVPCGKGTRWRIQYTEWCREDKDGQERCTRNLLKNQTVTCSVANANLTDCITKAPTEGPRIISGIVWAEWEAFGPCSASCGEGQKQRWREGVVIQAYGESLVNTSTTKQSQTLDCTDKVCESCSFCQSWYQYSACSSTCGMGTQTRECENWLSSYDPFICQQSRETNVQNCTGPPCEEPEEPENQSTQSSVMGVMGVLVASLVTFAIIIIVMLFLKKRHTDRRRQTTRSNNSRGNFRRGFDWFQHFRRRGPNDPISPIRGRNNEAFQAGPQRPIRPPSYNTVQSSVGGMSSPCQLFSRCPPISPHHPTGRERIFTLGSSSSESAAEADLPPEYEETYIPINTGGNAELLTAAMPSPKGKPPPAYDDVFNTGTGQFPLDETDDDISPPPYE